MAVQAGKLSDGRQATYEVIGEGRPTLMLPGGPGFAAEYMRRDAELFSDVLQSYLIDPHGSGGSTPPADPTHYSPEGHARFYEDTRSALGLGRVVVFGHSFGATTALTYAALYPESVTACIAVAPFGVGIEADQAGGADAAAEMEAMMARHREAPWYPEAEEVWGSWTERVLATDDPAEVDAMMAAVLPLYAAHPERPEVWAALEEFKTHFKSDLVASKAWEDGLSPYRGPAGLAGGCAPEASWATGAVEPERDVDGLVLLRASRHEQLEAHGLRDEDAAVELCGAGPRVISIVARLERHDGAPSRKLVPLLRS